MRQFLVKRSRLGSLKSIEVFEEHEHLELGVAADLARIEGHEIEVFLGFDLLDVVRSHKRFFEEREAA